MKDEYKKRLTLFRKNGNENTEEYSQYLNSKEARKDKRGKGFSQKAQGQFQLAIEREKEEALADLHEGYLKDDFSDEDQYEEGLRFG